MKQHVYVEDLEKLSNEQQIELATLFGEYGNCSRIGGESINLGRLHERITIGKMLKVIEKRYEKFEIQPSNNLCVGYYIKTPYDEGGNYDPRILASKTASILHTDKSEVDDIKENGLCDALFMVIRDMVIERMKRYE